MLSGRFNIGNPIDVDRKRRYINQMKTKRKRKNMVIDQGLQRVLKTVGSRYQLAKMLGLTPPAIYKWKRIPADRIIAIEKATGIDRSKIRPDLYDRVS
jgi:Putative antitoxin of bacterial toxin-antitoxin system, YdaS/YdaT